MTTIQPAERPVVDAALALLDKHTASACKALMALALPTITVDRLESAAQEVQASLKDADTPLSHSAAGALRLALFMLMEQISKLAERAQKLGVGQQDMEATIVSAQALSDRLVQYRTNWSE